MPAGRRPSRAGCGRSSTAEPDTPSSAWPVDAGHLEAVQRALGAAAAESWEVPAGAYRVGGCWVCFPRGATGPGGSADPAWVAAVTMADDEIVDQHLVTGTARSPYLSGLLALRSGPLLEQAVRGLRRRPEVLMLDASGRDHPRGAGLAVHLGAVLDVPTVGVTHRPLLAEGPWPEDRRGATSPLRIGEEVVATWVRTRSGARPLVAHPGWATDLPTAVAVVTGTTERRRTPEPLRRARELARTARAGTG
jgi:deoxyribonuclease V